MGKSVPSRSSTKSGVHDGDQRGSYAKSQKPPPERIQKLLDSGKFKNAAQVFDHLGIKHQTGYGILRKFKKHTDS